MFFADQDYMKRGSHSGVRAARRQHESRALILHMGMYCFVYVLGCGT